ncbi:MAG: DUF6429 family protein [Sulfuricaulis sp.]
MKPQINTDCIDDAVLALVVSELRNTGNVWKGIDWDAMNLLYEKGFISNPVGKAKSVGFSGEGESRAKCLFEQMFTS